MVPGRANRILDRFVNKVAISFRDTRSYFKNNNIVFTGNPLRKNIISTNRKNPSEDKFTILVMGGSQGAHSLNVLASDSVNQLKSEVGKDVEIFHITGVKDFRAIKDFYKKTNISAKVFSFIENIHDVYEVSDLAISRSGAAAIFELSLYAKPMILIPYPFKKNNQRFNAQYFADKGAAIYREEDALTSENLKDLIRTLIEDRNALNSLSLNAKKLSCPNAAKNLAGEIIKLVK